MNCIIVRFSEIGLKGKNRKHFEDRLITNIRAHLEPFGRVKIKKHWGRMEVMVEHDLDVILDILGKIPGISNMSPVVPCELNMEAIEATAKLVIGKKLADLEGEVVTFRVSARRANKDFPAMSSDIERAVGSVLGEEFSQLKVQLKNPDLDVGVEIWDEQAVVYTEKRPGLGGLPVNSKERVLSLISGGIDSPVASYMIMKRGVEVVYLYFHSFPFIGEQTKEKVMDLVKQLSVFQPKSRLYVAPFAEIQKAIKAQAPERLRTVLYRRYMNQIANRVMRQERAQALVTGDSLAQVASQTLANMICTTENADYPVLRPLVGMDKNEIMKIARNIGTYETSIQDFPDCCTVFQPAKPATKAILSEVKEAEANIENSAELVRQAVEGAEVVDYSCTEFQLVYR